LARLAQDQKHIAKIKVEVMKDLSQELFLQTSALFNRAYNNQPENLPARVFDGTENMSGCKGCQCVSCKSSGCNK